VELNQDISALDMDEVVNGLLEQNSQLRLELASLKASLKQAIQESTRLAQMKQSQNIPKEAWEMISQLDIR